MDLNRVTLIGNISSIPESKKLSTGATVTKTHLATSLAWKDKKSGEFKEKSDFHTVIGWNKLGDRMAQYLKKGDRVYIEGRVDNRSFAGKDGVTKYFTDIVAERMIMLGKSKRVEVTDTEPVAEPITEPF